MLSKNKIKEISSLHQKKFRNETGLFLAEGVKVVHDLLFSDFEVTDVFATNNFIYGEFKSWKFKKEIELHLVTESELHKISSFSTPQEVLAVGVMKTGLPDPKKFQKQLTFAIDGIRDPGNLGTIIRIADWFGISAIICSEDTVDCYNPKVVQAAMGSLFRVDVHYADLEDLLPMLKSSEGIPLIGTSLDGESIYNAKLPADGIILLGNESAGVRRELLELTDQKISIPAFSTDKKNRADSLNVSVAAGIIATEIRRRESK